MAGKNDEFPDALKIYLQDHLAGSTAGVSLARRIRDSNEGSELGAEMTRITAEIEEDAAALRRLMDQLSIPGSELKNRIAWLAERLGRLKPNGALTGPTDLGRLTELEGLFLGISGKLSLWENLSETIGDRPEAKQLPELIDRARSQQQALESHRRAAAREALEAPGALETPGTPGAGPQP